MGLEPGEPPCLALNWWNPDPSVKLRASFCVVCGFAVLAFLSNALRVLGSRVDEGGFGVLGLGLRVCDRVGPDALFILEPPSPTQIKP